MIKQLVTVTIVGTLALCASPSKKAKLDLSKLPPAAQAASVTYAAHIQPIFEASCIKCHGPEKSKGKLRLDSLESALKGGESGKAILPGKSAESILVHSVGHIGDDEYFMPPPDNKAGIKKLTAEQVALIRAWIDQGAK